MLRRGLLDLAVGCGVGLHAAVFLPGRSADVAVVALLCAAAGAMWRRGYAAVLLTVLAELTGRLLLDPSPSNSWNAPLVLLVAAVLGAGTGNRRALVGIAILTGSLIGSSAWSETPADVWSILWALIVTVGVALAARLMSHAARRARAEGQRRRDVSATSPEEVARQAVVEERERLAADVQTVVRTAVTAMLHQATAAASWGADSQVRLSAVQEEGRRAMVELRRLLGLLRDVPTEFAVPGGGSRRARERTATIAPGRPARSWHDPAVAVALVALAVVERSFSQPAGDDSSWSIPLTVVAAGSIGLRGRSPGAGAAICGLALLTSALSGHPVGQGFWWIAVLGGLMWSALAHRRWRHRVGAVVMLTGAAVLLAGYYPENLTLSVLLLVALGAAAHATARRTDQAESEVEQTRRLSEERADAVSHAVQSERLAVARDLHDTVSHAVVVMVMQAGAAQALADNDRAAASKCIEEVKAVATDTLRDLDRLSQVIGEGTASAPGGRNADVRALVARMRAGGLAIDLEDRDDGHHPDPIVYRLVQESLTNALRYAPNAHVRVTISIRGEARMIEVVDDGPGPAAAASRGYGLIGMTERVESLGGSFEAGPGPSGCGFQVRALVPSAQREAQ
ncbi:MAG TPA: histidine kinase [Micromonosporaceae bacterium]